MFSKDNILNDVEFATCKREAAISQVKCTIAEKYAFLGSGV